MSFPLTFDDAVRIVRGARVMNFTDYNSVYAYIERMLIAYQQRGTLDPQVHALWEKGGKE